MKRVYGKYIAGLLLFGLNGIVSSKIILSSYDFLLCDRICRHSICICPGSDRAEKRRHPACLQLSDGRRICPRRSSAYHACRLFPVVLDPVSGHCQHWNRLLSLFFRYCKTSDHFGFHPRLPRTSVSGRIFLFAAARVLFSAGGPRCSIDSCRCTPLGMDGHVSQLIIFLIAFS